MSSSIINLLPKLWFSLLERADQESSRDQEIRGGMWNVHRTGESDQTHLRGLWWKLSMQLNGNSNHKLGEGDLISSSAEADGLWSWARAMLSQGQARLIDPHHPALLAITYSKLFNKTLCHLIMWRHGRTSDPEQHMGSEVRGSPATI